jgi:hypothetical protein
VKIFVIIQFKNIFIPSSFYNAEDENIHHGFANCFICVRVRVHVCETGSL